MSGLCVNPCEGRESILDCTNRTEPDKSNQFFCIIYGKKFRFCPAKCAFYQKGEPIVKKAEINLICRNLGHFDGDFYCIDSGQFGIFNCSDCPSEN
ncbi:MAG: hypothetical protein ACFFC7_15965 [Candidatus Hermodarchaeota archaeon]